MRQNILNNTSYFTKTQDFCNMLQQYKNANVYKNNLEIVCSFDIETTSFQTEAGEKQAIMYCWTFCVEGFVYFGRTWEEFSKLLESLRVLFKVTTKRRLVIYVHNLAFEWQFIKYRHNWDNVFAIDQMPETYKGKRYQCRQPLYAITSDGFEFRCSYMLSNKSLDKVGQDLTKYEITKKTGSLDYSKYRHTGTKLTSQEIRYCIDDVKVVVAYIWEELETYKHLADIPMTNTGRVRAECRRRCLKSPRFSSLIQHSKLTPESYQACKRAFQGGFVHGNASHIGKTLKNVTSLDFTSSYPSVMLSEKFPVGCPEKIDTETLTQEKFEELLQYSWTVFDIHFQNIKRKKNAPDDVISVSRCFHTKNHRTNNGRVYSAEELSITITGTDFETYRQFYEWESFRVSNLYAWRKAFLPRELIECVLDFYEAKTTLKDVEGKETEYQLLKGMLNSIYGMMVTDVVRNKNKFLGTCWEMVENEQGKQITKYNYAKNRFTLYPWGVAITAYARRNLLLGVLSVGSDYVYSDTDSIKLINYKKHRKYFETYNKNIIARIMYNLNMLGIDPNRMKPKTIKGIEKPLGVWDIEGTVDRFKTLGAKRYMQETNGTLKITVAGVNKQTGAAYLQTLSDPFEAFKDGMVFPAEYSGKNALTYLDSVMEGELTDYNGNRCKYFEYSGVHIAPCSYEMGLTGEFKRFIMEYINRYTQIKENAKE